MKFLIRDLLPPMDDAEFETRPATELLHINPNADIRFQKHLQNLGSDIDVVDVIISFLERGLMGKATGGGKGDTPHAFVSPQYSVTHELLRLFIVFYFPFCLLHTSCEMLFP